MVGVCNGFGGFVDRLLLLLLSIISISSSSDIFGVRIRDVFGLFISLILWLWLPDAVDIGPKFIFLLPLPSPLPPKNKLILSFPPIIPFSTLILSPNTQSFPLILSLFIILFFASLYSFINLRKCLEPDSRNPIISFRISVPSALHNDFNFK